MLRTRVSAAALAAAIIAPGIALANQDYHVIEGIGPQVSPQVSPRASQPQPRRAHLGHPSLNPAPFVSDQPPRYDAPQRHAAASASGAYGGGFIELVMTGRDPTPRSAVMNTPPAPPPDGAYQRFRGNYGAPPPVDVAPRAAPARQAAIAPQAGLPSRRIQPRFERQEVEYDGRHEPGTIIVDTPRRYLYLVLANGRALRYGIGVGRPGFEWAGVKSVTRKAEWPDWRPPPEMRKRRPDLPTFMAGGPDNPLGARALYLGSSLYRIHGTNEPWTIGRNVSSGCIRMMNDDVVDLYGRVRVGTKVVVI